MSTLPALTTFPPYPTAYLSPLLFLIYPHCSYQLSTFLPALQPTYQFLFLLILTLPALITFSRYPTDYLSHILYLIYPPSYYHLPSFSYSLLITSIVPDIPFQLLSPFLPTVPTYQILIPTIPALITFPPYPTANASVSISLDTHAPWSLLALRNLLQIPRLCLAIYRVS